MAGKPSPGLTTIWIKLESIAVARSRSARRRTRKRICCRTEKLSRFLPSDIWVKDWYIHVMDHPKNYSKPVAAYLCREHASLQPISITLLEIDQKEFWPADQLSGKSPFDFEFLEKKTLATVPCPKD